jgi:hypothetical protein
VKPRHAAALALVGWYLMVPPTETSAPLPQWKIAATFDSGDQCTRSLSGLRDDANKEVATRENAGAGYLGTQKDRDAWAAAQNKQITLYQAQCVAADDPRLKDK